MGFVRRAATAAGVVAAAAFLVMLASEHAPANCALFAPAVQALVSDDGSVDRPFAAPGDTVTVYAADACNPAATNPFFSPLAANN
jgi:hypothetical protein